MPPWAVVALTLGSAAVAAAAVLIAMRLQLRHAAQGRRAADKARQRERAALAVAPVLSLLDEIEPQRLTSVPDTRTMTIMNELWERSAIRSLLLAPLIRRDTSSNSRGLWRPTSPTHSRAFTGLSTTCLSRGLPRRSKLRRRIIRRRERGPTSCSPPFATDSPELRPLAGSIT
jgi:hypothetical protein